jgi:hypothetical protein
MKTGSEEESVAVSVERIVTRGEGEGMKFQVQFLSSVLAMTAPGPPTTTFSLVAIVRSLEGCSSIGGVFHALLSSCFAEGGRVSKRQ